MPTPPMLQTRSAAPGPHHRPDPLVALDIAGMSVVCLGLLLAGILAVYDYSTPGAEAPLVLTTAAVAVVLLLVNVLVMGLRHVRRIRLGL